MFKKLIFIGLFLSGLSAFSNELQPFVTDYCTMFVDGTLEKPTLWRHCCVEHDMHYWYGGSIVNQSNADLHLKACVENVAGPIWAGLIYSGVRAGHYSPFKNKYKWGWGWVNPRENIELNKVEINYVLEELRRLPYSPEMIERYIKNNF